MKTGLHLNDEPRSERPKTATTMVHRTVLEDRRVCAQNLKKINVLVKISPDILARIRGNLKYFLCVFITIDEIWFHSQN